MRVRQRQDFASDKTSPATRLRQRQDFANDKTMARNNPIFAAYCWSKPRGGVSRGSSRGDPAKRRVTSGKI
jgi:hypothetical protein